MKECVPVAVGCRRVWRYSHWRSSGRSSCICTASRQIGGEQQALQTAVALMMSKRAGVQTDVGGIKRTSERNLLMKCHCRARATHSVLFASSVLASRPPSLDLYTHLCPPATATVTCPHCQQAPVYPPCRKVTFLIFKVIHM